MTQPGLCTEMILAATSSSPQTIGDNPATDTSSPKTHPERWLAAASWYAKEIMRRARRMTRLPNDRLLMTNNHCRMTTTVLPATLPWRILEYMHNMLMSRIRVQNRFSLQPVRISVRSANCLVFIPPTCVYLKIFQSGINCVKCVWNDVFGLIINCDIYIDVRFQVHTFAYYPLSTGRTRVILPYPREVRPRKL